MKKSLGFLISIFLLLQFIGCKAANPTLSTEGCSVDRTQPSSEVLNPTDNTPYADILVDYERLVDFRLSDTLEHDWNNGSRIAFSDTLIQAKNDATEERASYGLSLDVKWSYMLAGMTDDLQDPEKESFGYFLKDINGDSVLELFWVREDKVVLAIFTACERQPVLLDAFWSRYDCVITAKGELCTLAAGGVGYDRYDIRLLAVDGKLSTVKSFGSNGWDAASGVKYYETINGEDISVSESRFHALTEEYPFAHGIDWDEIDIVFLSN